MRAFAVAAALVACSTRNAAPHNVTIPAASVSTSAPTEAPYAVTARSAFDAAEALDRAGRTNEARIAYEEIVRKYAYSISARQARERLATLSARDDTTVGDVTCQVDTDCAVTNKRECCDCCPRKALATSKKWLEWRDGACSVKKCAGCEESCLPENGRSARCNAGKCELTKK